MSSQKRIEYLDIFRGIGIFLMVMGHTDFGGVWSYFIHAFHMPMFFFISGYFYKEKSISTLEILTKKIKTLLLPYIIFGVFHFGIWYFIYYPDVNFQPLIDLFWVNTEDTLAIANALWFLTAIFSIEIIYHLLRNRIKDDRVLSVVVVVIVLIGNMSKYLISFRLPWALDAAFVGIGFYHIAHMIHKYDNRIIRRLLNLNVVWSIVVGLLTCVLIYINGYVNMRTQTYDIIPLFWINALLAIFVGISLSKIIDGFLGNTRFVKYLKKVGKNSITYLCLNQMFILIFNTIFEYFGLQFWIARVPTLVFVMFCLTLCDEVIRRTKLRFVLALRHKGVRPCAKQRM